jgi:hypothetical protein
MSEPTISYKNHRFPHQIIAHAVWLHFSVPLELAAGRRNAVGARHRRVLRNDPSMGPKIRSGLCEAVAQKETVSKRYLAFGRGGDFHPRPKTLA